MSSSSSSSSSNSGSNSSSNISSNSINISSSSIGSDIQSLLTHTEQMEIITVNIVQKIISALKDKQDPVTLFQESLRTTLYKYKTDRKTRKMMVAALKTIVDALKSYCQLNSGEIEDRNIQAIHKVSFISLFSLLDI